jgi:hypothetical protein
VEALIEKNVVAPVSVDLEFQSSAEDRTPGLFVTQEDAGQPIEYLPAHLKVARSKEEIMR